jgi:hypothetical protein
MNEDERFCALQHVYKFNPGVDLAGVAKSIKSFSDALDDASDDSVTGSMGYA